MTFVPPSGAWPVHRHFPVDLLHASTRFKRGDERGVTGSLRDVETWDPEKAGRLTVWRDPADGRVYALNGHNRLDLARRTGQRMIAVRFIGEP